MKEGDNSKKRISIVISKTRGVENLCFMPVDRENVIK